MKFFLLIFDKQFFDINNVEKIDKSNIKPHLIFEYFKYFFLYEYYHIISIVKLKQSYIKNHKFDNTHKQN